MKISARRDSDHARRAGLARPPDVHHRPRRCPLQVDVTAMDFSGCQLLGPRCEWCGVCETWRRSRRGVAKPGSGDRRPASGQRRSATNDEGQVLIEASGPPLRRAPGPSVVRLREKQLLVFRGVVLEAPALRLKLWQYQRVAESRTWSRRGPGLIASWVSVLSRIERPR